MIAGKGARFGFYFHYMPVGSDAVPDLLPTVEQRKYMIQRIRYIRSAECPIEFFPMDFQNDGQYVAAALPAGGTTSTSIRPATPNPASLSTIPTPTSTTAAFWRILRSPLFMAYRTASLQQEPSAALSMLENPACLEEMVHKTGAHNTDLASPETVEHLCANASGMRPNGSRRG